MANEAATMKIIMATHEAIDRMYEFGCQGDASPHRWETIDELAAAIGYASRISGYNLRTLLELAYDIGGPKLSTDDDDDTIQHLKEFAGLVIMRAMNCECDPYAETRLKRETDEFEFEED